MAFRDLQEHLAETFGNEAFDLDDLKHCSVDDPRARSAAKYRHDKNWMRRKQKALKKQIDSDNRARRLRLYVERLPLLPFSRGVTLEQVLDMTCAEACESRIDVMYMMRVRDAWTVHGIAKIFGLTADEVRALLRTRKLPVDVG